MPATRKSPNADLAPEQRRDEIISILAAGLVRLIQAGDTAPGMSADSEQSVPAGALPSMPAEKLSESGEIGLELPGETRLSVVAG